MVSASLVVKLGGRALEGPNAPAELAADLAALARPRVVVHGGGAEVSEWSRRLGIEPRFVEGLRVTDAPTLEVATAVLAGLANKRLVAALRARGVDAVGLAALDGGIAHVVPHPRAAELGAVGAVARVDRTLVDALLAGGRTPVLASLAALDGALLNVNADDFAVAIAIALGASELVLLSDAPGVRLDGEVVASLDASALERALAHPDVTGGMTAKLVAAREAITHGVGRVHVAAWQGPGTLAGLLTGRASGTRITAHSKENVHV